MVGVVGVYGGSWRENREYSLYFIAYIDEVIKK